MKHLLILIFLFPLLSFGQSKTNKNDTINGEEVYYYPEGTIRAKGNRKNGDWIEFFENGNTKIKQTFINGKLSGETYCYSEKGNIILPYFISQTIVKNDTSISNNSNLNLYTIFDSRDSTNEILHLETYLSDSIKICDNGNLTIRIGAILLTIKSSVLGVHINFDNACKENVAAQRFSINPVTEKVKTGYFKIQLGKIEVEHKQGLCSTTGHNPLKISNAEETIYFKNTNNLIFFEYDVDKGGNKELFILNYSLCDKVLKIYKVDE